MIYPRYTGRENVKDYLVTYLSKMRGVRHEETPGEEEGTGHHPVEGCVGYSRIVVVDRCDDGDKKSKYSLSLYTWQRSHVQEEDPLV